jgi:hypothetical protein
MPKGDQPMPNDRRSLAVIMLAFACFIGRTGIAQTNYARYCTTPSTQAVGLEDVIGQGAIDRWESARAF